MRNRLTLVPVAISPLSAWVAVNRARNLTMPNCTVTSTRVTFSTRDCQFRARKRVAATCTGTATRGATARRKPRRVVRDLGCSVTLAER